MWKYLLTICLVNSVQAGLEKSFINFGSFVCPREERALGRCLRDALNSYIPRLTKGLPEYGVPPCEPLLVPSINVQQATGPVSVTSEYTDVTVRGPSTMRVKDITVDIENHEIIGQIYIPELRMKGHYNLKGQLLMLPIEGKGDFTGKYSDIDAVVTIVLGRRPRPNNVDSLSCKHLDVKFHMGDAAVQLENLFGADNEIGKAMNNFVNDNWKKLSEELQRPMEEALRDFLKPLADHAFSTLDADDILSS